MVVVVIVAVVVVMVVVEVAVGGSGSGSGRGSRRRRRRSGTSSCSVVLVVLVSANIGQASALGKKLICQKQFKIHRLSPLAIRQGFLLHMNCGSSSSSTHSSISNTISSSSCNLLAVLGQGKLGRRQS